MCEALSNPAKVTKELEGEIDTLIAISVVSKRLAERLRVEKEKLEHGTEEQINWKSWWCNP